MAHVFVFGSNLAGRHGKGASLEAVNRYDAVYGKGIGRWGDSYAIPTKDQWLHVLDLETISYHIDDFLKHARLHPRDKFVVSAIGTGLAGFTAEQIAELFYDVPENVYISGKLYNAK